MSGQKRLLIVDDDKIHSVIYSSIAAKMQYQVDLAESPRTADEALRWKHYDCVILDLMLGEDPGTQVLALMSRLPVKPRVLIVTGAADDVIAEALRIGREFGLEMFGPVRKPVDVTLIRTVLRSMEIAAQSAAPA
jgi:two-component system chemotaxis response regulator CheY